MDRDDAAQGTLEHRVRSRLRRTGARHKLGERVFQARKLESLGTLVSGVAHNINNVLAIAMGTASLREQLATDPADLEAYQIIGRVCRRGREVMKSLIPFPQPSLASHGPIELNQPIREFRRLLGSIAGPSVRITEAYSGEALWINGELGSLRQALMNLCLNALDAMPDLVILDLNMPGLNGFQTMERIRDRHPGLPILISSGQPDIEGWDCIKQSGAAVIAKPFTMAELRTKLAEFAGKVHPGASGN